LRASQPSASCALPTIRNRAAPGPDGRPRFAAPGNGAAATRLVTPRVAVDPPSSHPCEPQPPFLYEPQPALWPALHRFPARIEVRIQGAGGGVTASR
jgi:hypothetical protein